MRASIPSASESSASSTSGEAVACPARGSDRQMLACLHAFASHHLKALQAADARYRLPAVYDVLDEPTAAAAEHLTVFGAGGTADGGGAGDGAAASVTEAAWLSARLKVSAGVSGAAMLLS